MASSGRCTRRRGARCAGRRPRRGWSRRRAPRGRCAARRWWRRRRRPTRSSGWRNGTPGRTPTIPAASAGPGASGSSPEARRGRGRRCAGRRTGRRRRGAATPACPWRERPDLGAGSGPRAGDRSGAVGERRPPAELAATDSSPTEVGQGERVAAGGRPRPARRRGRRAARSTTVAEQLECAGRRRAPRPRCTGTPSSAGVAGPRSRTANSRAMPSACTRRATKARAPSDSSSSHWASSTQISSGPSRAASASSDSSGQARPGTARPADRRPGPRRPRARPAGSVGSPSMLSRNGTSRRWSAANGKADSASTPTTAPRAGRGRARPRGQQRGLADPGLAAEHEHAAQAAARRRSPRRSAIASAAPAVRPDRAGSRATPAAGLGHGATDYTSSGCDRRGIAVAWRPRRRQHAHEHRSDPRHHRPRPRLLGDAPELGGLDHPLRGKGYTVIAPAYPGFEVEVEALNADPTPIVDVTGPGDHRPPRSEVVGAIETPPIIMGHSAGGAFTQVLLDHGFGAAGVALNSAPTEGVKVVPFVADQVDVPGAEEPGQPPQGGGAHLRAVALRLHQHLPRGPVPRALRALRRPRLRPHPLGQRAGQLRARPPGHLGRLQERRPGPAAVHLRHRGPHHAAEDPAVERQALQVRHRHRDDRVRGPAPAARPGGWEEVADAPSTGPGPRPHRLRARLGDGPSGSPTSAGPRSSSRSGGGGSSPTRRSTRPAAPTRSAGARRPPSRGPGARRRTTSARSTSCCSPTTTTPTTSTTPAGRCSPTAAGRDDRRRRPPARRRRPGPRRRGTTTRRRARPAVDRGHRDAVPPRSAAQPPDRRRRRRLRPRVGRPGATACCGSPATPSSTTACGRWPTGSTSTWRCCTSAGCSFGITGPVRYTMTAAEAVELCALVRPPSRPRALRGLVALPRGPPDHRTGPRRRTRRGPPPLPPPADRPDPFLA